MATLNNDDVTIVPSPSPPPHPIVQSFGAGFLLKYNVYIY